MASSWPNFWANSVTFALLSACGEACHCELTVDLDGLWTEAQQLLAARFDNARLPRPAEDDGHLTVPRALAAARGGEPPRLPASLARLRRPTTGAARGA